MPKNYMSLSRLTTFFDELKKLFATKKDVSEANNALSNRIEDLEKSTSSTALTVVQETEGATIIATDKNGTTEAFLSNGKSGVHVGVEAPEDNSNVWINPEGKESSLVGKSAYEVALDHGFDGSEEEWLESLVGKDYVLTETDKTEIAEEASALVDTSGFVAKNQGAANAGKILVVGTDGELTLTDMPEGGASGDVVGTLDGANNILLTGALASGTYTLKYEYEDGTVSDVGIIEVGAIPEPEPEPTNLFVIGGDGYIESGRCSSTGANRTDASTCFVTNYIKVSKGDVVYIKGYATPTASAAFSGIKYTGGTTGGFMLETETSIVKDFSLSNGIAQVTINDDNADYVRFTINKTYPLDSIVITVNQKIV
jgi:hypothetical protein